MTSELLQISGDEVRVVLMARTDKHNALSRELFAALVAAISQAQDDPRVRVVILGAVGANFCAGGDMAEFLSSHLGTLESGYEEIPDSMELFAMAFRLKKPLIVATKGICRGGGVGLSALGHVTVAARDTSFALTEVQLGLFPYGIFPLLAKNMGERRSLELALTGRVFDAETALGYGLVDEVVDDPLQRAHEIAGVISKGSALALTSGLELYNEMSWHYPQGIFQRAGVLRLLAFKSEELRGRVERFLSKRSTNEAS